MCGVTRAAEMQAPPGPFSVKPSDVVIPEGVKLGEYRRVIQPFKNWILICDESLKAKRRVCNITQSIVDPEGGVIFNWTLVATMTGQPLMIMRIPAAAGAGRQIELSMDKTADRIIAQTDRCDVAFCSATIAVGDMLKKHIQTGTPCLISFQLPQAGTIAFQAPLDGLFVALSGLK